MPGDDSFEVWLKQEMQRQLDRQVMLETGKLLYGDMSGPFADVMRGPEYDKWRDEMDKEKNAT